MRAALASMEVSWHKLASCKGLPHEVFFGVDDEARPTKPMTPVQTAAARAVCQNCLVRTDCLLYALEGDEKWGVWGGYNRPERERMVDTWGWDIPADLREPADRPSAELAVPHIMSAVAAGTLDATVRLL